MNNSKFVTSIVFLNFYFKKKDLILFDFKFERFAGLQGFLLRLFQSFICFRLASK